MRIGYSFWGFLGDQKYDRGGNEVSSPDGNAAYSWSIVWEAMNRAHSVLPLQQDRDQPGFRIHGPKLFDSFSKDKRLAAYGHLAAAHAFYESSQKLPELDVVLVEWRWPIPGRNCEVIDGKVTLPFWRGLSDDLRRQTEILRHYSSLGVPIILWDLDHKITPKDEIEWGPHAIFETAVNPRAQHIVRTRVEPPVCAEELHQFKTLEPDPKRKLVYVGSRYERDDVIDDYIKPISERHPGEVEFWGKWDQADQIWPTVSYHGRIGMKDFRKAYGTAVACPLLAKRSYLESGFITPRVWESLMFGTIPMGLFEHAGVHEYTEFFLGHDANMSANELEVLMSFSLSERDDLRRKMIDKLDFMDASKFVNRIEDVVAKTVG